MTKIAEAQKLLCSVEESINTLALYVANGEDPYAALLKIRTYLAGFAESGGIALGVACLDRVIDTLRGYDARTIYERRRV
jgi:hypothetical protein